MSTQTPPGGAQSATPPDQPIRVADACLHGFYYLGQPNGDRFQVVRLNDDGSIAVKAPGGAQVVRLDKRHVLYAAPASVEANDAARPPAPGASASLSPVDLPDGLWGTPKPNAGGHLDRARIEAALPTMTEEQLTDLLDRDKRAFVGSLVNNERERRERAAKAPRPLAATAPSKIVLTYAAAHVPPRVSATTSPISPRGQAVASAPPSYPSSSPQPQPQPKTPRAAPKAAPTPPQAPAAQAAPSHPNDDRAARARAALAVLNKNAEALIECAAAYKELEALGLTAPRFM